MKVRFSHSFEDLISIDNLLQGFQEFTKGKRSKKDVQEFSFYLMDNIFNLHNDLVNKNYRHGGYQVFYICDPKPRIIHKATVRDRVLHHSVYRKLYPFFDRTFISDSFSCRNNKGTHKAIKRLNEFSNKVSKNNTKTCWVLKCDIQKFFANVNHKTLIDILEERIIDKDIIWLLKQIIYSFSYGLPLGNLTSQLFVNIYMNEFDQYVKHKLKAKYYIRYTDDFVFLSDNKDELLNLLPLVKDFLNNNLSLTLHPNKVFIKTLNSGIDFLGWIHFSDHLVLRTSSKKRMFRRIRSNPKPEALVSYLGLLGHGNTYKLREELLDIYFAADEKQDIIQ